jgi:hypothetical protein
MLQNPSSLNDLLYAIKCNNEVKPITFNHQTWQMSDFIFNEIKINGNSYFSKSEFENEINNILEQTKGPVKGIWDRNPGINSGIKTTMEDAKKIQKKNREQAIKLHKRAHIIMNNYNLKKEIEQKTEDWFNEFFKITNGTQTVIRKNLKDEWNAKKDPFGKRIQKSDTDFDKVIINKLIWRRIVIKLYKIDNSVNIDYKTTSWIAGVEKNGCLRESTDSDKKKLFSHLGFEYRDNTIYMHNLFPEEEGYISKF